MEFVYFVILFTYLVHDFIIHLSPVPLINVLYI